jgi:hypothetical protein
MDAATLFDIIDAFSSNSREIKNSSRFFENAFLSTRILNEECKKNTVLLSSFFQLSPRCPHSDHLSASLSLRFRCTPRSYCGEDWCDGRALFSPRTMGAAFMREARLVALLFGRLTASGTRGQMRKNNQR